MYVSKVETGTNHNYIIIIKNSIHYLPSNQEPIDTFTSTVNRSTN